MGFAFIPPCQMRLVMMCLSNTPARFFLLFGLGLTIGTTNAIGQAQTSTSKPVTVENCRVDLFDRIELAASVPGVLEFVTPEIGDEVVAEDIIVGIQADVMKAQQAVANKEKENDVEVRYAKAAYELAEAEHRKALEANQRLAGTVAQIEVERLKLAAERARLQIEQAEFTLAVAELKAKEADANVAVYQIKSPINGTVVDRLKSRGEAVRQGDIILEIQSTARLRIDGEIKVEDMFRVKRGDKVKVKINIPGLSLPEGQQELEGLLTLVAPTIDPINQKVRVVAEVQNPKDILKAGVPTTMTILPGTAKEVQTTRLDSRR